MSSRSSRPHHRANPVLLVAKRFGEISRRSALLVGRLELRVLALQARTSEARGLGAESLLAWNALDVAGRIGDPIPAWVSAYLRDAALKLIALAERPENLSPEDTLRALRLGESRKGNSPRNAYQCFRRDWKLALSVMREIENGASVKAAAIDVAKVFGTSASTVKRARTALAAAVDEPL